MPQKRLEQAALDVEQGCPGENIRLTLGSRFRNLLASCVALNKLLRHSEPKLLLKWAQGRAMSQKTHPWLHALCVLVRLLETSQETGASSSAGSTRREGWWQLWATHKGPGEYLEDQGIAGAARGTSRLASGAGAWGHENRGIGPGRGKQGQGRAPQEARILLPSALCHRGAIWQWSDKDPAESFKQPVLLPVRM